MAPRKYLYIKEWLHHRDLTNEAAAKKLGIAPNSVNRWIHEQQRLTPPKIAQIAEILEIEPEQLWRPPGS